MKTEEREEARRLRREEGRSIREIERMLGVARSSVSLWVRDIELTPAQHQALRQRNPIYDAQRTGSRVWAAMCRERRRVWQAEGRALARRGDPMHAAGCMLYWAEGEKSRHTAGLCNSDPEVVRFFVSFLRTYFDVPNGKIRLRCNLFADHVQRQREIEQFWLDSLDLPRECMWESAVNVYSKYSLRKRKNKLPYGTCRVVAFDVSTSSTSRRIFRSCGSLASPT